MSLAPLKVADIEKIVKENQSIIVDSSEHDLKLSENGMLGSQTMRLFGKAFMTKT